MQVVDTLVSSIVAETAKTGAQERAVEKAVRRMYEILGGEPGLVAAQPKAKIGIFVCSGNTPTRDDRQKLWATLQRAKDRFAQPIEVVTLGGFGTELTARNWAQRNDMPTTEFAVTWHTVALDGTTTRSPRDVAKRRDQLLAAYAQRFELALALKYGVGQKADQLRADASYNALVKAGVYCSGNPVPQDLVAA
jgi:hypothetical protein